MPSTVEERAFGGKTIHIDEAEEIKCFEKAKLRGDTTFTVVGQDLTSPAVVCEWIKLNIETAPQAKLFEALERAIQMRDNPKRKHAD